MIEYRQTILDNGLTVLANRDRESKMAAVNIIYRVGSRNEQADHTGFAHLFEHLMFRGTRRIPDFDSPVQLASGENNAFTSNDYTDYYITLPKENIETALWLESDRMCGLNITRQKLEAEKSVVVEEFNQRYLNQPYGQEWLMLRPMVYTVHPYRWPTIGSTPDHIRNATLQQVKEFYSRFYTPRNAILSVSADIEPQTIFDLAAKWFSSVESPQQTPQPPLPQEPEQTEARRKEVEMNVPADKITIAFVMASRDERRYYVADMLSDILAGGTSSRLYRRLIKEQHLFSSVNAYITGDIDRGMFVVTAILLPQTTTAQAEEALWNQLREVQTTEPESYEIEKVKNKFEANTLFGELNVMNKAMNMGYYTMLGNTDLMNQEIEIYRSIEPREVVATAMELFAPQRSSTLIIRSKQ